MASARGTDQDTHSLSEAEVASFTEVGNRRGRKQRPYSCVPSKDNGRIRSGDREALPSCGLGISRGLIKQGVSILCRREGEEKGTGLVGPGEWFAVG